MTQNWSSSRALSRCDAEKADFSCIAYYAYAEVLPDKKPADTVLEALEGIPVGTLVEEIKRK